MKKIYLYLFTTISCVLLLLTACNNVQPDTATTLTILVPGEPAFPREIPVFPYEGKELVIKVRTNQPNFTFSVGQEWLQCEQIASDSLKLTVPNYNGIGSRSTELILKAGVGDLEVTRVFTVLQASEFNLAFDKADVDENGVLWFNSINKISKYVGDEKIISIRAAAHGQKEATLASDLLIGADTTGVIDEGDDSRITGAIRLARASSIGMVNDGGAIEISVKSCSKLVLYLSSSSTMRAGLTHNTGNGFENIILYGGVFQPNLSPSGQYVWNCAAEGNGKILKNGEQTIRIFNMTNKYVYIHGIELLY